MDEPGLGVSTSLGQVSATRTTNTSTADFVPPASSGATITGHDIPLDQESEFSEGESLPGLSNKDSEDGEMSDTETQEQNEEISTGSTCLLRLDPYLRL